MTEQVCGQSGSKLIDRVVVRIPKVMVYGAIAIVVVLSGRALRPDQADRMRVADRPAGKVAGR